MGCGQSKLEETDLVRLCRERRQFILSAVDERYALAAAHSAYIQSLVRVGELLHLFVNERFVPVDPSSSPVLTIPDDGKKVSRKSCSASTSLSHSLSHRSSQASHLNFNSDESDAESDPLLHSPVVDSDHRSSPVHESPARSLQATVNHMKSSAIPSVVFVEQMPPYDPETVMWGGSDWAFSEPAKDPTVQSPSLKPQPPPSPPKTSHWDFFNPFTGYENMYEYYAGNQNSNGSSPDFDLSELRLKEGIPDLEDELEVGDVKEVAKDQKPGVVTKKELSGNKGSESGHILIVKEDDESNHSHHLRAEKEDAVPPAAGGELKTAAASANHQRGVSLTEAALEGDGESTKVIVMSTTQCTKGILNAIAEIKAQFMDASQSASEVSVILEVGKLPYRPKNIIVKAKTPKFSFNLLSNSPSDVVDSREDFPMKSDKLSAVLEEICTWENKLYREVKVEEKMRLNYENNLKRLRHLESKGAEPQKLFAIQATIRKHLTRISISMKAIDSTSAKLHMLRDYELQDQLTRLIEGMTKMWKAMLLSHQKQLQAFSEGKTSSIMWRSMSRDEIMKGIMELEKEASRWCSSFIDWMNAQRVYIESLNNWLLRCMHQEQEVTADGIVPFSPGRMGAPPVFVICNDWYHMTKGISVDQVVAAMHAFAENMHKLWEQLGEEQRQSMKTDFLSSDLKKRHRLLQEEENKMQGSNGVTDKLAISVKKNNRIPLVDRKMALDAMMKRLEEQKLKNVEVAKEIQDGILDTLRTGLSQIFEAMRDLASSIVKGYEEIRIPKVGK
ncbi:hypothetical protein EJ110_NYTH31497 [Nymphaea thermarum]|nr:hypothetical protein EJ110_NYTH31497 [Nymphaea thermarum]